MLEELNNFPRLREVSDALRSRFGESLLGESFERGELSVRIRREDLLRILGFLKGDLGFKALDDLIALDLWPRIGARGERFSLLYQLYDFSSRLRVRVVIDLAEAEEVDSITRLYPSSDWAEREAFDMFGIRFSGHPNLRRIYMPEDFEDHPLRKDFPLEGKRRGV